MLDSVSLHIGFLRAFDKYMKLKNLNIIYNIKIRFNFVILL